MTYSEMIKCLGQIISDGNYGTIRIKHNGASIQEFVVEGSFKTYEEVKQVYSNK